MSLYDAMFSGVAGLSSQSNAMSAISDNIANVNTIGYKGTTVSFSTLVTPQSQATNASGSVQSRPRSGVDIQGMLQSSSSTTDMSILGDGFFVVSSQSNPTSTASQFGYTRAGSFKTDNSGYLQNAAGYYLQGWPLVPSDGTPASVPSQMNINGSTYMHAYRNSDGTYHYVDQSSINPTSLKPLNTQNIGGTAEATSNLTMKANLPAAEPIYDQTNPTAGGKHSTAVPIYDSLGNSLNSTFTWSKVNANGWNLGVSPPVGAAVVNAVNQTSTGTKIYGSQGQLEFTKLPMSGDSISLKSYDANNTMQGNVTIQFFNSATPGSSDPTNDTSGVLGVDLNGLSDVPSFVTSLQNRLSTVANTPYANTTGTPNIAKALSGNLSDGASRFSANGSALAITQEPGAYRMDVDCSKCAATLESNTNAGSINAGLSSLSAGTFTIPAIDTSYATAKAGSLSFTMNNVPSTNGNLQIGQYQIPWSKIAAGSIGTTDIKDITGKTTPTLNSAITLPSGALNGAASDSFTVPAAPTGNLTIGNATIPWSEAVGGTISSYVDSTGTTKTLTPAISVGGSTATAYASAMAAAFTAIGQSGITVSSSGAALTVATAAGTAALVNTGNAGATLANGSTQETVGNTGTLSLGQLTANAAAVLNNLMANNGSSGITLTDAFGNALSGSAFTAASSGASLSLTAASASAPSLAFIADNKGNATDISWNNPNGTTSAGTTGQMLGGVGGYDLKNGTAAVFNGDGTPANIIPNSMQIAWANGAENQNGSVNASGLRTSIALNLGAPNQTSGLTQYSDSYTANSTRDGAKFGNFSGVSVGTDGVVTALFDNGMRRPVFQIPIATFANPDGLIAQSGNVWTEGSASGSFTLRTAGDGGAGKVQSSQLETSTVDLSTEFTNMITVQRAYSASAKVITTADQMLDDLINLKR